MKRVRVVWPAMCFVTTTGSMRWRSRPTASQCSLPAKNGTVRRWNRETGAAEIIINNAVPVGVIVPGPGDLIATGDVRGIVKLWNLKTNAHEIIGRVEGAIKGLVFSADGTRIAVSTEALEIVVWKLGNREPEHRFGKDRSDAGNHITFSGISGDGEYAVTSFEDGRLSLFHVATGKVRDVSSLLPAPAQRVAVSRDGRQLVAALRSGAIHLVDLQAKTSRRLGAHTGMVEWIEFSPSGKRVATAGGDLTVRIWGIANAVDNRMLRGHEDSVYQVLFAPDESYVVSASDDRTARIWDLRTDANKVLRGHHDDVYRVALDRTGANVATASLDGTVRVWPTRWDDSRDLLGHDSGMVGQLVLHDNTLISQAVGGTVRTWNVQSGESRVLGKLWPGPGFPNWQRIIRGIVSPKGTYVAGPNKKGGADVLSTPTGKQLLVPAKSPLWPIAFSLDDRWLVSSPKEGGIVRWDLKKMKSERLLEGEHYSAIAIAPSKEEHIAVASPGKLAILHTDSRKIVASIKTPGVALA